MAHDSRLVFKAEFSLGAAANLAAGPHDAAGDPEGDERRQIVKHEPGQSEGQSVIPRVIRSFDTPASKNQLLLLSDTDHRVAKPSPSHPFPELLIR